ncbi:Zonadhesin [Arthrobotrys entomopaga]|nr:Zonadhesin [Arthrobotrys entomopaga]
MPPKKNKGKKKNSLIATAAKENGDVDPLSGSVPQTPADDKDQVFSTPLDKPENPLDAPVANGATSNPAETETVPDKMAKAEGDEAAAAWGLDDEKPKVIVEEPDFLPDTAEKLENGDVPEEVKHAEPTTEEAAQTEHPTEEAPAPVDEVPETKAEGTAPEEEKSAPPVDFDIPDTADATEPTVEHHFEEKAAIEEPTTTEAAIDEPLAEKPANEEPPAEQPPTGEPVEEPHAEVAPTDEAPVDTAPVEEAPVDIAPVEEAPVETAAVEEAPVEDAAVKETPAEATAEATTEATVEEHVAEKVESVEPAPEPTPEEPEVKEQTDPAEPEPVTTEETAEVETAPEPVTTEETAEVETAPEPIAETPAFPGRPLMEAPRPATLVSLTSSDRDFTSTRYQATTSPQFLNKPHEVANHSLDLDDRNMQSSVNNWYKKISSFSESLNWRPGWEYIEEFDHFIKSTEAPLSQISLLPANEWWADKPKDPSIEWDKIDEKTAKYEEFWEWKSKIALSAICSNFACREIFGKTVFGLDPKMTRKLGVAMSVFSQDFGDDITATRFRHMTLKLLQESKAFQSSSRKQLVHLAQELANVLSPLTSFMPPANPKTEEEKAQHAHYTPLVLSLYEKVLLATQTLHDTFQKDHKYFALFHPVPGVEFDETTMEESTFEGLGAGKGAVALVARPGLARLGLPRGGEPEDITIVHKALVVREDAMEDAIKHFDEQSRDQFDEQVAPPAE